MRTKPVFIGGKECNGPQLAAETGIAPWEVVRKRLARGWDAESAFNTPVHVAGDSKPKDQDSADWHEKELRRHERAADWHRERRDAAIARLKAVAESQQWMIDQGL